MSTAGKTVLLTALLIVGLGAAPQSNAQEKILTISFGSIKESTTCSPLKDYIYLSENNCQDAKSKQADQVKKAAQNTKKDETFGGFSYETEPTYYVRSVSDTTPTESKAPETVVTETSTPTPPLQTPQDMVPAAGPNLDSNMIFDLINAHRASIGKAPFQKDEALCALATTRSYELHGELFEGKGYLHSGLYNRNLPYWITENAKWGSNEAGTVQWWLNSPIHRRAIQGDYIYSCGACNGSQCSQLFTSYSPKNQIPPSKPLASNSQQ